MISRCQQRAWFYLTHLTNHKISDAKDNAFQHSEHYDRANLLRIDSVRAIHVTKSGHPSSCASLA